MPKRKLSETENYINIISKIRNKLEFLNAIDNCDGKKLEETKKYDFGSEDLDNIKKILDVNLYADACIEGNLEKMKIIDKYSKADLTYEDEDCHDLYLISVKKGYLHIMKYLEKKHNWIVDDEALTLSHKHKKDDIAKYLIDLHIKNKIFTDLKLSFYYVYLVNNDNLDMMKYFDQRMKKYEKINFLKYYGLPHMLDCYQTAVRNGNMRIVKYLEQQLDIDYAEKSNVKKYDLFLLAVISGNEEMIDHIEKKMKQHVKEWTIESCKDNKDNNVYMYVVAEGHMHLLKKFTKYSNNHEYKNKKGFNSYLFAASFGQLEVMKYLESVYKPEDLYISNRNGCNAYLLAAISGNIEVIKHLMKKNKFNLKCKDKKSRCVYHHAAKGTLECIKYLLEENIFDTKNDKNICDGIINVAIKHGKLDILKFLLETMRLINIKPRVDISTAICHGQIKITKFLFETYYKKIESSDNLYLHAVKHSNIANIKYLSKFFNVKEKDDGGKNALMLACQNNDINFFKYIDKRNICDPYARDKYKSNVYMMAIYLEKIEHLEYLEKYNFSLNLKDKYGNTSYLQALHTKNEKIIKHVLSRIFNSKNDIEKNKECIVCRETFKNDDKCIKCIKNHVVHSDCVFEQVIQGYAKEEKFNCVYCKDPYIQSTLKFQEI